MLQGSGPPHGRQPGARFRSQALPPSWHSQGSSPLGTLVLAQGGLPALCTLSLSSLPRTPAHMLRAGPRAWRTRRSPYAVGLTLHLASCWFWN